MVFTHGRFIELQKDETDSKKTKDVLTELHKLWLLVYQMFNRCEKSDLYKKALPYVTLSQSFALLVRMVMQELLSETTKESGK